MAVPSADAVTSPGGWRRAPEAGTILGIRIVVAVATILGRRVATAFLWVLAFYYTLVARRARRASRDYLARVGETPSFGAVMRHIHTFARVSVDRLFFLRGRTDGFEVECHGDEHLYALTEAKKGAILLGSHLGSFEAMRAMGVAQGMRLSVVVDKRSAERMDRVLRAISPDWTVGIIPVDPDGVGTALLVRDAIKRGELVGILADRTVPEEHRNVTVDFLGARAHLPAGAYLLAHTLKCPVLTVFGIFAAPNRYDLYCEPLCDELVLDRDAREESLASYAQRYAARLEEHAKRAPYNWFNFYDFWISPERGSDGSR